MSLWPPRKLFGIEQRARYQFRLHRCHHLRVPRRWAIAPRRNDDLHLLFVREGYGEYRILDQTVELRRGTMIFVGDGVLHASRTLPGKELPLIVSLRFGRYLHHSKVYEPLGSEYVMWAEVSPPVFEPYFLRIAELWEEWSAQVRDEVFCDLRVNTLLWLIFAEFFTMKDNELSRSIDARIAAVLKTIHREPLHFCSLMEMADAAGLSQKHFCRLFKAATGISPGQYLLREKMNYARYLLQETSLSLAEIATRLGYSDQAHFSRQFRRHQQCAPSSLRYGHGR